VRKNIFHQKQNLITQSQNMDCLAQAIKVSRNLVHAWANARSSKPGFFPHFVSSNAISSHDLKLILCMLGRWHKLQNKIRKPIPKGPFTKLFTCSVYLHAKSIFNNEGHIED
jgi:hypothetical protein